MKLNPKRRFIAVGVAVAIATSLVLGVASAAPEATEHSGSSCMLNYDPTPLGQEVPSDRFIKLPFRERDARNSLIVTNGHYNASDEAMYTGLVTHDALDFEFVNSPDHGYGLPLLAAAKGRAYYTYQYITEAWTDPKTGEVHQLGVGAGLVLELRLENGYVLQYIHPSKIAEGIPYIKPVKVGERDWAPVGLRQSNDILWNLGVPVEEGQVIAWQGDTGIGDNWWDNFNVDTGQVAERNRTLLKPWDPPQLHVQVYKGRDAAGNKIGIIDPTGVWGQPRPELNAYGKPGKLCLGPRSVIKIDRRGKPLYAG